MVDGFDLFGFLKSQQRSARRQRPPAPPRTPWRALLPMRTTARGLTYTDPERAECMATALTGEYPSVESARFLEALSHEMADGRVALRVFSLRGSAPERVPGTRHLSCRASQRARGILNGRTEARGPVRLPFRGMFTKGTPVGVLRHGHLVIERSFDLALVPGGVHRAGQETWPTLGLWRAPEEPELRGCPLIVGNSTATDSWTHLLHCAGAGLAIWPSGSLLWLFKVVPGHTFPAVLNAQPHYTAANAS